MLRVKKIVENPLWRAEMDRILELERDRRFCRHGIYHLLSVSRIAYIEKLERNLPINKEIIYAAALLHDIGRARQYEQGVAHEEAGADIAKKVLKEAGFNECEIQTVVEAILYHRGGIQETDNELAKIIRRADNKSRSCTFCEAESECYKDWKQKNQGIEV